MKKEWQVLRIVSGDASLIIVALLRKQEKGFAFDCFVDKVGVNGVQVSDAVLDWIEEMAKNLATQYDLAAQMIEDVILGLVATAVEQKNL